MRVACIQMCSGDDVAANLSVVSDLLAKAGAEGVKLAVLPENFSFMSPVIGVKRHIAEEVSPTRVLPFLAEAAARHAMYIVGGSLLLPGIDGKLRNASPFFNSDGTCAAVYDKIHLFDVNLPGENYRESDTVQAGRDPICLDVEGWRLGLSICYDIRFPELYRHYAREGCGLLSVPAAFTVPTGQAHWEILLRARAIENQAYVLAAAQGGTHPGGRRTWGRSMIIDPWGVIAAQLDGEPDGEGILLIADIDPERVESVRRLIPSLGHRRIWGDDAKGREGAS